MKWSDVEFLINSLISGEEIDHQNNNKCPEGVICTDDVKPIDVCIECRSNYFNNKRKEMLKEYGEI